MLSRYCRYDKFLPAMAVSPLSIKNPLMKTIFAIASFSLLIGCTLSVQAQSTTGGRSGGSTASTGTGYLTEGKRAAAGSPASMTIADEGASRDYMYVPPTNVKNRSASPDGSGNSTPAKPTSSTSTKTKSQAGLPKKQTGQPKGTD